jgi:hypothetical protein
VDDYCSRCRLLSNHAIAAIVDDVIKQTRCSTCDFEHPYKDGKLPVRRAKKDGTSALYKQVLDNVTDGAPDDAAAKPVAPARAAVARPDAPRPASLLPDPPAIDTSVAVPVAAPAPAAAAPTLVRPAAAAASAPPAAPAPLAAAPVEQSDDERDDGNVGIVHRRLIRATLPKIEGAERDPRPIPVFTVHEAANARGKFRRFPRPAGHGFGHGNGNGNGQGGNGNAMPRFGHGGQPSPFGAQGRSHGKGGGPRPNQGGGQHGNRNQQQRRGNKGR